MTWLSDLWNSLDVNLFSIVDILLVSFIFYKLIEMIKDTRVIQILKGVLVLIIANIISNWLGLQTMSWLLKQTMTVLVVALPVIFAPELRRWLENLGRGSFFESSGQMEEEKRTRLINELVRTAFVLSKDKVGALIVLAQDTNLEEYVRSGIALDALCSAELLINIFVKNTPLHDGAVIIREDRIVAAASILPLSGNPYLNKEMGTRHRAAIGLTETTDAVCLVVSEETGAISVAFEGKISRWLDENSLREQLEKLLVREKHTSRWSFLFSR